VRKTFSTYRQPKEGKRKNAKPSTEATLRAFVQRAFVSGNFVCVHFENQKYARVWVPRVCLAYISISCVCCIHLGAAQCSAHIWQTVTPTYTATAATNCTTSCDDVDDVGQC